MKYTYVGPHLIIGLIGALAAVFFGIFSEGVDRTRFFFGGVLIFIAFSLLGLIGAIYVWIKTR